MSQLALTEGAVFADRYQVVRCIAMGGMGAVYEVVHLETERRRALKVMLPHIVQSPELRDRFRQEARVAAHVDSEHIVDVFDAGVDGATGMPFLVMELLKGEELGDLLRRVGRLDATSVVTYLHQVSLALDKSHRAHVVHRDLKPGNVFLAHREDGRHLVKVLDFGIAKLVAEGATNANATRSLGTPLYMAPEQFRPNGRVSPATDIYALGMMAYTLLVGTIYWHEESINQSNVYAFAAIAVHGPPEPASVRAARHGVTLPPAFDAWFAQVTAVDPADRFLSASAAVRALAVALGVAHPADGAHFAPGPYPADRGSHQSLPQVAYAASQSSPGTPHAVDPLRPSSAGLSMTRPRSGHGSALLTVAAVSLGALGVGLGAFLLLRDRAPEVPASHQAQMPSGAPVASAPPPALGPPAAGTTEASADILPPPTPVTPVISPSASASASATPAANAVPASNASRLAKPAPPRPSPTPAPPAPPSGASSPPIYARD